MISVKLGNDTLKGYAQIQLKNGKKIQLKNGRNRIGNKSFYCQINLREVKKTKEQSTKWREEHPEEYKVQNKETREQKDRRNELARERLDELKRLHPKKYAKFLAYRRKLNRKQRLKKKELQKQ